MKINIVGGSGIMGKIHAAALINQGHEVIITGRNSETTPIEASKNTDLTIVSVPLSKTEEVIKQVGPFCKAITDFSSVKVKPIEWMKKHCSENCEIFGTHPLYGETNSIKGKTIVFCKNERSGKICEALADSFSKEGAKILFLEADKHDFIVNGLAQNARTVLLETFGELLIENNIDIKDFYEISPSPTKKILDLLARQVNKQNDELYSEMKKLNPFHEKISEDLKKVLNEKLKKDSPEKIRDLFGDELEKAQDRAKKIISLE